MSVTAKPDDATDTEEDTIVGALETYDWVGGFMRAPSPQHAHAPLQLIGSR